jgi:cellulose synthase/poly-beta-1,6-N-acetylglucosamine synthase-like glycosyltransferase
MATLTWIALAVVVYVYAGYPLALWTLAYCRSRSIRKRDITPSVSLIISAFNEAPSIRKKIENSLNSDYPADLLEIIVVSDASSDDTDSIAREYAGRGVKLVRMPTRGGKTIGLNAAVPTAHGEIVVFSDANIFYQKQAIRSLVRSFGDPSVGCVTGDSRYSNQHESAASFQESSYWEYERSIRSWESAIGSTVGGDGAIFAIRKELYLPLRGDAINDFVTPLQIVSRGHRAVFEPAAVGLEASPGNFRAEFRRKRRVVNRSWRGVLSVPEVLNPMKSGLFAWEVWSHKVLRWLVLPFVLVIALGCLLSFPLGIGYRLMALGFLASLAAALAGLFIPERFVGVARLAHAALYFYIVNIAAVIGIATALAGKVEVVWTPERGQS